MNATIPDVASARTELKATDRCDRCGARATTVATLSNGLELMFCNHHARQYEGSLKAQDIALS